MTRTFFSLGLLILPLFNIQVYAGLKWEEAEMKVRFVYGETKKELSFTGKNDSADAVEIKHIKSSCNCVKVLSYEKTIPSSGELELRVIFDTEGKTGSILREVILETTAKENYKLLINAEVPSVFPGFDHIIEWKEGAKLLPQDFVLKSESGIELLEIGLSNNNENVEATIVPLRKGTEYELCVKPKSRPEKREVAHIYLSGKAKIAGQEFTFSEAVKIILENNGFK